MGGLIGSMLLLRLYLMPSELPKHVDALIDGRAESHCRMKNQSNE